MAGAGIGGKHHSRSWSWTSSAACRISAAGMDFAGGIDGLPIKLIEFNADTPAVLPESAYFQQWMAEPVIDQYKGQLNYLVQDMAQVFGDIRKQFPDRPATLLLTSLGHEEDRLNLAIIEEAAEAAGFAVDYADLDMIIFAEDGVYLDHAAEKRLRAIPFYVQNGALGGHHARRA